MQLRSPGCLFNFLSAVCFISLTMILNFYNQLFILFVIFNSISGIHSSLQCKDDLGNDVDWSVVYKIPKESKNYQSNGLQTVYVTSNGETSWTPSKYLINNIENIIGSTLLPLYTSSPSVNYILYSDQPNKGEHISDNGHSKGVLIFDSSSGFWLIHSVPSFPNDPKISPKYDYPDSGEVNGQIFLCISFKTQAALPKIIHQLLYIRPHVYSNSVSETMVQQIPELAALINKKWIKQSYSQSDFETLGGQTFTSFSKSPSAHLDIYSQIAAPSLKIDLLAETWRKGAGGPLPSECNLTYQVVNIDQVSIIYPDKPAVWSYTEDHSKWAISVESNTPIVCVGDTNRMASQAKRGGGLVCMKNQKVWKTLHSSVHQIESCPRTSSKKDKSIFTRIINFFTSIFTTKFSLPAKTLTKDRTKKELR